MLTPHIKIAAKVTNIFVRKKNFEEKIYFCGANAYFFMMKGLETIILLVLSNIMMTTAWYGHLKLGEFEWFKRWPLIAVILVSWGVAFFEYCLQVPANRIGFEGNGGPFSLMQLKVIQEVITLLVFIAFSMVAFHVEIRWNHLVAAVLLVLAVYFVFGFK